MYSKKEVESMLVFDIETVGQYASLQQMPKKLKEVWLYRYHNKFKASALEEIKKLEISGKPIMFDPENENDIYLKYSPLVAEFNKVISISFSKWDSKTKQIDTTSITSDDELEVLKGAAEIFDELKTDSLTGFNIKGFDIPVLFKRYIINGLAVPVAINFKGKKPWEINVIDVMEDWKGSMWESCAFETFCEVLGIGSTKDGNANGENLGILWHTNKVTLKDIDVYTQADTDHLLKAILKVSGL